MMTFLLHWDRMRNGEFAMQLADCLLVKRMSDLTRATLIINMSPFQAQDHQYGFLLDLFNFQCFLMLVVQVYSLI